jgi:hypothetical protein
LVTLHSFRKEEFAEIRYARFGVRFDGTLTGPRMTRQLKRRFGQYYPADEGSVSDSSLAGQITTLWFKNAVDSGRHYFASSVWTAPMFAHIAYGHNPAGSAEPRKTIVGSLQFVAGPTLIGTWRQQGEGITFSENGQFERFYIFDERTNRTQQTGAYRVQGTAIVLRPSSSQDSQQCEFGIDGQTLTLCGERYIRK